MKLKHIFALLLVATAFVGCQKEGVEPKNSKEMETFQESKQLIQDLSSLAAANRMLALTDFKATSKKIVAKDIERTNADIDHLIKYFFRANHDRMLYKEIVGYTVNKDSRFKSIEDLTTSDYEDKVRVLRAKAIFAMWSCSTRASLLSEIDTYIKQRSLLFRSTSASNQAHDTKVSELGWHKFKFFKAVKHYNIKLITPDGTFEFECAEDEYILDAAEENGISLPCSSRCGADPSSAALLISGAIDQSDQSFLDDDQMNQGFVLLDVAYPLSDCTLLTHMEDKIDQSAKDIKMGGDYPRVRGYTQ